MRDEEIGPTTFEGDAPTATTREALPDRRELALVALERTRMPMVVTNARHPDNPIVLANRAFLKLTGYEAVEVIGHNCRFLQGPDTNPGAIAIIRNGLANAQEIEVELLNYRKDGSSFWNQLAITPIEDDEGHLLYFFASQKDVSARRRAEAIEHSERLLLMEVDHRAMNALALVQSFVRLGSANSVEAYARGVQQRVDALAQAHCLLAKNNWSEVELGDLLDMRIKDAASPRIVLSGPKLVIAARIVQPVALAFHELMDNALRHGALACPHGRLTIEWENEDERVVVRWTESDAPLVPAEYREGFGISLLRGVIERQLHGTVKLDWSGSGLNATLAFALGGRPRAERDGQPRNFR